MASNVSLRAIGLQQLLQKHPDSTIEFLATLTTDTLKSIEHTLKELEEAGYVAPRGLKQTSETLHERVCRIGRQGRIHDLIAWFLKEQGVEYYSDSGLKERILSEYPAARTIQYWGNEEIFASYAEILSKKTVEKVLSMQDVLDCLNTRTGTTT